VQQRFPEYLKETEVSKITGFALPTLRNWRFIGKGPAYVKPGGRAIRYSREAVIEFMETVHVEPDARRSTSAHAGEAAK
jgi:predicted DNA-binding transcriptional regulator AlpA